MSLEVIAIVGVGVSLAAIILSGQRRAAEERRAIRTDLHSLGERVPRLEGAFAFFDRRFLPLTASSDSLARGNAGGGSPRRHPFWNDPLDRTLGAAPRLAPPRPAPPPPGELAGRTGRENRWRAALHIAWRPATAAGRIP